MTSDEQSPQSAVTDPVGQQLRRARERLGLGLSDIADQQHLRSSIIQAIEDGDYQKIDTELFLKGYVRAYAKHVGLDADSVIRDLDAELEPARKQREQELEANPLVDIERKKRRKRQVARVLIVLLLIGLVAGGVAYYVAGTAEQGLTTDMSETSEAFEQSEPSPSTEQAAAASITEATNDAEAISTIDALPANESSEVLDTLEPELDEPAMADASEPESVVEDDTAARDEPNLTVEEVSQVTQTPDPALTQQAVLEEETSPLVELAIRFQGDCWVQISDASGNRLASSLQRDGNELVVTGEAPLRVVIGAMSAVESIEFQGDALDQNDFRVVNNRAEFTLAL